MAKPSSMTPLEQCEAIIAGANEQCDVILEKAVRRVLTRSKRYSAFAASMGAVSFYNADGSPCWDEQLTDQAKRVVELAERLTDAFGSPGMQITRKDL